MTIIDPSPAFTAWLGDALLQCSALLALALVADRLMRRAPAAWRHAGLLAAAVGVPLLFVLSAVLPSWKLPKSEPLSAPFQAKAIEVETSVSYEIGAPLAPSRATPTPAPPSTLPPGSPQVEIASEPSSLLLPWLLVAWGIGTLASWLRLTAGILALRRHRRCDDRPLAATIAEEAQRLGVAAAPELVLLPPGSMPMTWRLRHHVLALPESARAWPADKLRRVIRHELAHVLRDDCRTTWLGDACLALLWFHPLAWLHRRALGRAREAACDDLALRTDSDEDARDNYARDLLDIVANHSRMTRGTGLALAMADRRKGMRRRLESILDPERDRRPVSRRARRWMIPLWIGGIAGLATVAACRMDSPESEAADNSGEGDGKIIVKEYRLVEHQQRFLGILSSEIGPAEDPFASASAEPSQLEVWIEGPEGASAARNALQNYGIEIASDSPTRFLLKDRYTLEVKADVETHAKIKDALDGKDTRRQVKIQLRVFEVDDLAWLSEFVSVENGPHHTGLLTHAQRDEVIAKLKEKSGGDTTFREFPSVVTRFGQKAKVEAIRELIYPTEYDPPEIPQKWEQPGGGDGKIFYGSFPVTPSNPTAFETRNVGTVFEIEPLAKAGDTVELTISIEETRFLGFVNYGAAINTMGKTALGKPVPVLLTENRIEQPVFRTNRMNTAVVIPPGRVLVLTGLRGSANPKMDEAISSDAVDRAVFDPGANAGLKPIAPDPLMKGFLYIVEPTLIEAN